MVVVLPTELKDDLVGSEECHAENRLYLYRNIFHNEVNWVVFRDQFKGAKMGTLYLDRMADGKKKIILARLDDNKSREDLEHMAEIAQVTKSHFKRGMKFNNFGGKLRFERRRPSWSPRMKWWE